MVLEKYNIAEKINKLKLVASGIDDNRVFFIIKKNSNFFFLFPSFLVSCGFKDLGVFDAYQIARPKLKMIRNKVQRFTNSEYDIDLVYGSRDIYIFVRTIENNRELLIDKFRRIACF